MFNNIELINLSNNEINSSAIPGLIKAFSNFKNLKNLDISNNIFTLSSMYYFKDFNSKLIYLDLSNNNISDKGIKHLTDEIKNKKFTTLEELHLINIKITDIGADYIINILDDLPSLKEITLLKNNFSNEKKTEIEEIFNKKGIEIFI
jgi:hypothetical protein